MRLLIIALILFMGASSAAIDLSGSSPSMAKGFAEANNLSTFQPWSFPAYGHYATEAWPDLNVNGLPNSLMTFMSADVAIPPDVINNTTEA
jgi:hypothetical protein